MKLAFYHSPSIVRNTLQTFQENDVVHVETIAKSGTHLLMKITDLFNIKRAGLGASNYSRHLGSKYNEILAGKPIDQIFLPTRKYFVLYRDPRDLLISKIYWFEKRYGLRIWGNLKGPDLKSNMNHIINLHLNESKGCAATSIGIGRLKTFELICKLKKLNLENVLLLRFEDLVPTHAGGSVEAQRFKVFKQICAFTHTSVTDEKVYSVMKKCWGGTNTFRASEPKKVGQWKKYFSKENIQLFHKKYNSLLLKLGYETSPNWHMQYLM